MEQSAPTSFEAGAFSCVDLYLAVAPCKALRRDIQLFELAVQRIRHGARHKLRRRLREVSIVQLRTQTGKPQLALLRLNAPFTGKRAPFGQQLRRGAEMAGEQTALLQLRPVDAHGTSTRFRPPRCLPQGRAA